MLTQENLIHKVKKKKKKKKNQALDMVLINAGVKYIENKRTFEEKLRLG